MQDDQDDGQEVNEDPDPVQPMPQDFHYPRKFVSSQLTNAKFVSSHLTNAKGDEIFYHVSDNWDREWEKRLEWAIKKHRDIAKDDLDKLQQDYEDVLRQSEQAHERKYDQQHIDALSRCKRIELANQAVRAHRLYAFMAWGNCTEQVILTYSVLSCQLITLIIFIISSNSIILNLIMSIYIFLI